MVLFIASILTVFSFSCFCNQPAKELIVELEVATPKLLFYVAEFTSPDTSFNEEYLKDLRKILLSDFHFSGRIQVQTLHATKEHFLKNKPLKEALSESFWKEDNSHYVVKAIINHKELELTLFSTEYLHLKTFKKYPLEGNLSKDRQALHNLSDLLHKHLFNQEGIASTKLLYALQTKASEKESPFPYHSRIWMCDYDGANPVCLTKEGRYCLTPCFYGAFDNSSTEFLYVSYEKGPAKIFLSSIHSTSSKPFIELRGNQLLPSISKDRCKIAFICDAGGRADLFIQPLHPEKGPIGKPIQAYSFPYSVQASPSFSPDGKKIAFVSDKEKTPKIYILKTPTYSSLKETPKLECITTKNRDNTCPQWSPDGKKIAYSSLTQGTRQIWIYDVEEKKEWQLTFGPYHKENPCWAPSNLHIVFNTADTNSADLYVVNLLDKTPVKITEGPGKKHYPAWSR